MTNIVIDFSSIQIFGPVVPEIMALVTGSIKVHVTEYVIVRNAEIVTGSPGGES